MSAARRTKSLSVNVLTSRRQSAIHGAMSSNPKRATVYFDPELHRALRVKAAETERSMSDLVNEAVQLSLAEDAEDLAAFEDRVNEPNLPYEDVVKDLKRRGKI